MGCRKGSHGMEFASLHHQSAKESLHLSSSLFIRGVWGWIEASAVALLCCLSGERGHGQRFFVKVILPTSRISGAQNELYGLCTAAGHVVHDRSSSSWFTHAQVPSATVTKSAKHQSLCTAGICLEPRAARANLCWNLSCYCSTASLKLSWLSQFMLGGSISMCKCKHDLWVITGPLSYQQFRLNVSCCSQPYPHMIW